jgi:hypothetical protein
MKIKRKQYGGARPILTGSPHVGVVGGFNLDVSVANFDVGAIIPGGSLAEYDESTRTVKVLKAARVKAISGSDAKIVTLDTDFIPSIFVVGDKVLKAVTGTLAAAPSITSVDDSGDNTVITLSAAITGLAVGDALFQVISDGTQDANAALPVSAPQGLTIAGDVIGTRVSLGATSVDVTTDTHGHAFYARRIPPIPASFREGNHLKNNPNVLLTDSR